MLLLYWSFIIERWSQRSEWWSAPTTPDHLEQNTADHPTASENPPVVDVNLVLHLTDYLATASQTKSWTENDSVLS